MIATVWPPDPEADSDASEACIVNMTPGLSWTTRSANLAYPMSPRSQWYTQQPLSMYQAGGAADGVGHEGGTLWRAGTHQG